MYMHTCLTFIYNVDVFDINVNTRARRHFCIRAHPIFSRLLPFIVKNNFFKKQADIKTVR
jgi:hypothetical protein